MKKSAHQQKKANARRERLRQARARVPAKRRTSRQIADSIMKSSGGFKHPAINVEIGLDGAERITRFGLIAQADIACPICARHGVAATLYLDSVEEGFKDAGVLIGHCRGCHTRDGVGVKSAAYWGFAPEDFDGAEVLPAPPVQALSACGRMTPCGRDKCECRAT